ncbi:hypothetical protein HANVADRAFT_53044 [Hanseniaspora valbyensis NRRL Y-1626]|uniref:Uncharacterized protein n=1 Tax=Hanseniaspora valbyensis NRRL Y-1626 TaxID=766949 RepID=A0A1B7TCY5_9ASCO|nr:hypothetical protein HANVADRAFT_53044 [Hanseniaspora valbyensis NRRL Y-1626]
MISPFENIKKKLNKHFKTKSYYNDLIISNQDVFSEYIECIEIDSKNSLEIFNKEENLKEKIFNLVCNIMIKKRDSLLIQIKKQFDWKNFIKKNILFSIFLSILGFFSYSFGYLYAKRDATFKEVFLASIRYNLQQCCYFIVIEFILYEVIFRRLKRKVNQHAFDIYDEDIKEYYDTRGESVFGNDFFLSENTITNNSNRNDFKIQVFKDKLSNQLNSVSIVKPLVESDDKIIMSIGFMGTLTDNKLMYTILDKMIDNIILDYELLKENYVNKSVELEFISRFIDSDLLNFLINCKGFKVDKQLTHSSKYYKGFNKFRFVKK